jgi:hypothetical protein
VYLGDSTRLTCVRQIWAWQMDAVCTNVSAEQGVGWDGWDGERKRRPGCLFSCVLFSGGGGYPVQEGDARMWDAGEGGVVMDGEGKRRERRSRRKRDKETRVEREGRVASVMCVSMCVRVRVRVCVCEHSVCVCV